MVLDEGFLTSKTHECVNAFDLKHSNYIIFALHEKSNSGFLINL